MLTVKAYEESTNYLFVVSDGTEENTFEYRWGKTPPPGQLLDEYLQSCKRDALLLAEDAIAKKQPPQEIVV